MSTAQEIYDTSVGNLSTSEKVRMVYLIAERLRAENPHLMDAVMSALRDAQSSDAPFAAADSSEEE